MPNAYPMALRERAVRAYETGPHSYAEVAARFEISLATLLRWVQRARATGTAAPFPRGGGWRSPVDLPVLHGLVRDRPDRTSDELTRAYNRAVSAAARGRLSHRPRPTRWATRPRVKASLRSSSGMEKMFSMDRLTDVLPHRE